MVNGAASFHTQGLLSRTVHSASRALISLGIGQHAREGSKYNFTEVESTCPLTGDNVPESL